MHLDRTNRLQPYAFPNLHYRPTETNIPVRFDGKFFQLPSAATRATFSVLQSNIVSLRKGKFCNEAEEQDASLLIPSLLVCSTLPPPPDDDGSLEPMVIFNEVECFCCCGCKNRLRFLTDTHL